jgi:hypothetical protein
VTIDELRALCQEAARDLAGRHGRPVPAAVVLPLSERTQIATLDEFPVDDRERFAVLSQFAADRMVPAGAPCYGFIAEAELASDDERVDVVMVAFGARQRGAWVTAAVIEDDVLGPFGEVESLDATALPFLQPLQHAADLASGANDVLGTGHENLLSLAQSPSESSAAEPGQDRGPDAGGSAAQEPRPED